MTFDPTQNRVPTCLLTADELAALKAAKYGWFLLSKYGSGWDYVDHPAWADDYIYRAKPAPAPTLSITVNGVTNVVAAGVTEALADGEAYWVAAPANHEFAWEGRWGRGQEDGLFLERGLIHLTEAAARAHAMAMVGLKAEGV